MPLTKIYFIASISLADYQPIDQYGIPAGSRGALEEYISLQSPQDLGPDSI